MDNHVKQIYGLVGNGSTDPLYAGLEGGSVWDAVIKTKENPQGVLALANEIVAYKLAAAADIPMPASGIAIIDSETDGQGLVTEASWGHCFYSERIDKAVIAIPSSLSSVRDPLLFARIILFDHLIYNKDRNLGNLLITIRRGVKKLYVIDHTHVFKNQTIWDAGCLRRGILENDYQDTAIMELNGYVGFTENARIDLDLLREAARVFETRYTSLMIDEAIENKPNDWTVRQDDLCALKEYLEYRVRHIDEICNVVDEWIRRC